MSQFMSNPYLKHNARPVQKETDRLDVPPPPPPPTASPSVSINSAQTHDAVGGEDIDERASLHLTPLTPTGGSTFVPSHSPPPRLPPPLILPTQTTIKTRNLDCVCHVWTPLPPPESALPIPRMVRDDSCRTLDSSKTRHSSSTIRRTNSSNRESRSRHRSSPTGYSAPPTKQQQQHRGLVLIFHGLNGHSLFPTVRYLAQLLVARNYLVYAPDFPGHGLSQGLPGYISSAEDLISDGVTFALYVKKRHADLPMFLAGSSMGGAIAAAVAREFQTSSLRMMGTTVASGLILLAPMVRVSVPKWQRRLLHLMAAVMPKRPLFPPAKDAGELQFRDPARREEIRNDGRSYKGSLRVGSAYACLRLTRKVEKSLGELELPILCLIGTEDVVVDSEGVIELMRKCRSADKRVLEYNALHGLLCESQPLRGAIEGDIFNWLDERTFAPPTIKEEETEAKDTEGEIQRDRSRSSSLGSSSRSRGGRKKRRKRPIARSDVRSDEDGIAVLERALAIARAGRASESSLKRF